MWDFGAYSNEEEPITMKMAPRIEDIIANEELFTICLQHMRRALPVDQYLVAMLADLLTHVKHVNNTRFPDNLFTTHVSQLIHVQISHLRQLRQFPEKYEYRINKLNHQQLQSLHRLTAMISLDNEPRNPKLDCQHTCQAVLECAPTRRPTKPKHDLNQRKPC